MTTPKRDMRVKPNKAHLGTAHNRDTYEREGCVILHDNSPRPVAPPIKGESDPVPHNPPVKP